MKRRLFLQGLLGVSASLPVLAKVAPKEIEKLLSVEPTTAIIAKQKNTPLTPDQIAREALQVLNNNLAGF